MLERRKRDLGIASRRLEIVPFNRLQEGHKAGEYGFVGMQLALDVVADGLKFGFEFEFGTADFGADDHVDGEGPEADQQGNEQGKPAPGAKAGAKDRSIQSFGRHTGANCPAPNMSCK